MPKNKAEYYESDFTPSNRKALEFCHKINTYLLQIMRAEIDAEILATEYYVCAGLGFRKYLN